MELNAVWPFNAKDESREAHDCPARDLAAAGIHPSSFGHDSAVRLQDSHHEGEIMAYLSPPPGYHPERGVPGRNSMDHYAIEDTLNRQPAKIIDTHIVGHHGPAQLDRHASSLSGKRRSAL